MGGRGAGSGQGKGGGGTGSQHRKGDQRKPHRIDIYSNNMHKWSLQKGEAMIRNRKNEVMLAYDEHGKLRAAYQGNKQSVAFDGLLMAQKGWTVTHSHPKGYENFGGTFSFADIHNFNQSQWAEHRATAGGQGEMNYILRATSKSDKTGFDKRLSKDQPRIERRYNAMYRAAWKKTHNIHVARQRATGLIKGYLKRVTPQYGIEFISRKKDYTYGR